MDLPAPFEVLTDRTDSRTRVTPVGELDLSSAPALQTALEAELTAGRDVHVDLSRLEFIDSRGISALLWCCRRGNALGREVVFGKDIPAPVQRLLELSGVQGTLPFED